MKTLKNIALISFIIFLILVFIFGNKETVEIEQAEEAPVNIIRDTKTVFDGLKEYTKTEEVKRKVELVEKESFLQYRKEELEKEYQKGISEIEEALDEVRGELAVS